MSIKAVIFDLDDTLYPEIDYVKSGFGVVAARIEERFGVNGVADKMLELFGTDRADVYGRTLAAFGIGRNEAFISELAEAYRSHIPNIKLDGAAVGVLAELGARGYKLGILTDGRPFGQRAKIFALGLDKLVDGIIVTDELGGEEYRKPDPKAFEFMLDRLGVAAEEAVYVGDNPNKDFAVKKYLPIKTVRIANGGFYADCACRDGIMPDRTVKTINEIPAAVGEING